MKYLITLIALFFLVFKNANGQEFFKLLGGNNQEVGISLIELSNGDLLSGATTESFGAGGKDILLTRVDNSGNILWSKTYGFNDDEDGRPINLIEFSNGDIFCSFFTTSFSQNRSSILLRLDANGNIIWQKEFNSGSGSITDFSRNGVMDNAGNLYIASTMNSQMFGSGDASITKFDPSGNLIWSKIIGVSLNDHMWDIQYLPNGNLLLGMNSQGLGPGQRSSVFVEMDANGNIITQKAFGGNGEDIMSNMKIMSSGEILVTGRTTSFGSGSRDAFIAKFDANYNNIWFKVYGGSQIDDGLAVDVKNDGTYLLYSIMYNQGNGTNDMTLVNLDANGNELWAKNIGSSGQEIAIGNYTKSMIYSTSGYIYMTSGYYNGMSSHDIMLFKVNEDGSTLCADTIINNSFHTIQETNVNFNIANLGQTETLNINTTNVNVSDETVCLCNSSSLSLLPQDSTICAGDSIVFDLPNSYSYQWSPSANFTCSTCDSVGFSTNVDVQIQLDVDMGGCQFTNIMDVFVNSVQLDATGPDTLCANSAVTFLSGSSSQNTFWSGPGIVDTTTGEFDPGQASLGTNEIIFYSPQSCKISDTIYIEIEPALNPIITSSIDTSCFNTVSDTLFSLSAMPSGGIWSGNVIYDPINGYFDESELSSGEQWVYYSISSQCGGVDSVSIYYEEVDTASIVYQDTLCNGDNPVQLTADYNGEWNGSGITDNINGIFDPNTVSAGNYEVYLSPEHSCIENDTILITVEQSSIPSITFVSDTSCFNTVTDTLYSLNATPSGGAWSGNVIYDPINGYFDESELSSGEQWVYYTLPGTCGGVDSVSIYFEEIDTASISFVDTVCQNGLPFQLNSDYNGTWSGDGIIDSQNGIFDPDLNQGNYQVNIDPGHSCIVPDTVNIYVDSTYEAIISTQGDIYCITADSIHLQAFPVNGSWSGFNYLDSTDVYFNPSLNGVGDHWLVYTPQQNCFIEDSILIEVVDLTVSVEDSVFLCENDGEFSLNGQPGGGIWSGSNGINNNTFDPSLTGDGVHEIIYSVDNGCTDQDTMIIVVYDVPEIDLGNDTVLCIGCEIELNVTYTNGSINWSNGSQSSIISVTEPGYYWVCVENQGCIECDTIYIDGVCERVLYLPNAFTPDGNGINDTYQMAGHDITYIEFKIFNRWGELIFETDDPYFQWDGMYKGKVVKDGVYAYSVKYYNCEDVLEEKLGHFTVIK